MATDVAMDDMDIDFDLDPEIERLNAEADAMRADTTTEDAMNGVEEVPEEGEVDSNAAVLNKVHIRGLNNLNTNDVKRFAEEHYSLDMFKRVEWVDDTSANLIYDTELAGAEALIELAAEEALDPLQIRRAKPLSTHPEIELFVRQAIVADVKAPNARTQSRFYLMNRDWDPESRPAKRRRPDYGDYGPNKYRRREYGDDDYQRRGSRDSGQFHEDMYDEGARPAAPRRADSYPRRESYSSDDSRRRKVRYGDGPELLPERSTGRLRNRSASPIKDGDGRYGFAEDQPRRATARARSRTPTGIRTSRDNRSTGRDLRKELFPDRRPASTMTNGHPEQARTNHNRPPSSSSRGIELFPDKAANHRRQQAKDLNPDEVAEAIGQRPQTNGRERSGAKSGRDLFARIEGGPRSLLRSDALQQPTKSSGDAGFSFRGASTDAGFSFRGASKQEPHPLVKELFPLKGRGSSNGDLIRGEGRLNGRGLVGRQRAEDFD